MSKFLRDEFLVNLSLNKEALTKINDDLLQVANQVNKNLDNSSEWRMNPNYIIRFDGKGFRLSDFKEVIKHFEDAKKVERFIFILDSKKSVSRFEGKYIDLNLDAKNSNNCILIVQDDDNAWVDATFYCLKERLARYRNKNFVVRNGWIHHIIQLLGVIVGILVSFLFAIKISPLLLINNAFAFSFIIMFLLFSNLWGPIYNGIIWLRDYYWPNINFKPKNDLHWLMQALISTIFLGLMFVVWSNLFTYVVTSIKLLLKP